MLYQMVVVYILRAAFLKILKGKLSVASSVEIQVARSRSRML